MLSKRANPHLNRKQRRHPEAAMPQGRPISGLSWLMTALIMNGGFWIRSTIKPALSPYAPRDQGKSVLGRAVKAFRNIFGGN